MSGWKAGRQGGRGETCGDRRARQEAAFKQKREKQKTQKRKKKPN